MKNFEAKRLMTKYLIDFIGPLGYKEKSVNATDFEFVRKTSNGHDLILGGITDYDPIQKITYSLAKQNKIILKVLLDFQKTGVKLNPSINKETSVIGFSQTSLDGINDSGELSDMINENDVESCVNKIILFLKNVAFPLLDKFEDIREIDKLVNGEDMWKTDRGMQYSLGGNFHIKRLIISKLSGSSNYDSVLSYINDEYSSQISGEYGFVYKKVLGDTQSLNDFLQNMKCLY